MQSMTRLVSDVVFLDERLCFVVLTISEYEARFNCEGMINRRVAEIVKNLK